MGEKDVQDYNGELHVGLVKLIARQFRGPAYGIQDSRLACSKLTTAYTGIL